MERLTGLDAAFLALETPSAHMHVMATMVFDPSNVPGGFGADTVKRLIAERLPLMPPFRRRLVTVPFGLHNPLWVEDPGFDLDYHVRRAALPAPGGPRELGRLTAEIAGRPLDRSRPLWEMSVVEGLEHGHVALIAKLHHAAIDGALGVELMSHFFDLDPIPVSDDDPPQLEKERVPSDVEMVLGAASSFVRRPVLFVRAARNAVRSGVKVVRRLRNEPVQAGVPLTAPMTRLNGVTTPHRRVAFASVPLADVKAVKNAFGVTVNDVVVAATSGALRTYLADRGGVPSRPLVAAIPASVRTEDERGVMGNRVSTMFATLAVQVADPVERLRSAHEVMAGAKAVHEDIGGQTLSQWAAVAAPAIFSRGMRIYERLLQGRHPPVINAILSNVPGPTFPLYCAGARLVGMFPMGPVMSGTGLNITVISYLDNVEVGIMACREIVPDVWAIADGFSHALDELVGAAGRSSRDAGAADPIDLTSPASWPIPTS